MGDILLLDQQTVRNNQSDGVHLLHGAQRNEIEDISALHIALLPNSPLSLMGKRFLSMFYYSKLINDQFITCYYYTYQNRAVGFVAFTTDPINFLKKGVFSNMFCFVWECILVFIRKPSKLCQIFRAYQLENVLSKAIKGEAAILSFGVEDYYRLRSFYRKTGRIISNELFEKVLEHLKSCGMDRMRLLIEPENRQAAFFYHQYGCSFQKVISKGRNLLLVNYSFSKN
jgi:ribosomal protein S18 acetylase RimI-like enzyme